MPSLRARLHTGTAGVISASLLLNAVPLVAQVAPNDATVSAGSATVSAPSANTVVVDQSSQKVVIDWRTFDVGTDQTLRFNQPNSSAIALNRIQNGAPTSIQGNLLANGQVWIINPNGIVFGKNARVDVAGLIATTLDISNGDFMAGRYTFTGKDDGAIVVNGGRITIRDAGLAALVAPNVQNSGVITAHYGKVTLGSATSFTLDFYGDGLTQFVAPDDVATALASKGADNGRVFVTASGVKSVVDRAIAVPQGAEATSIVSDGGKITLVAPATGTASVSGTVDVSAPQGRGGTIDVTGQNVLLADGAQLLASGSAQGGTVRVGGDWHGAGDLPNATNTTVENGALIDASSATGTGGSVDVWSDLRTSFAGRIDAGGALAGGNAEVSGKRLLNYTGTTDLRSASGNAGTLLLDPENVTISATGGTAPTLSASGPVNLNPSANDSILQVATLQNALALGNVIVTTGSVGTQAGDITVASNVSWSNASNLTLSANRNIVVNDGVTIANTGAGSLALHADSTGSGTGTVTFNGTGKVNYSGSTGTISIFYNPSGGYTAPTSFVSNVAMNGAVSNQLTAYMLVNDVNQLQAITTNNYALGRDIDASATSTWNGGSGFIPIRGSPSGTFQGVFDGQNHTITGLTINSSTSNAGLFANLTGIVRNLSITNANVRAQGNSVVAGIIAGYSEGATIMRVSTSGSVQGANAGGLLGWSVNSNIIYSFSTASVSSTTTGGSAGGLVGLNSGSITDSYARGPVTGAPNAFVGGLVGSNSITSSSQFGYVVGSILRSYATGAVTPPTGGYAGGIAGNNDGGTQSDGKTYRASITNTFWDIDATGRQSPSGYPFGGGTTANATGLTTTQLKSGLPTGFDPAIWVIDPAVNNGYPYLKWQTASTAPAPQNVSFGAGAPPPPPPATGCVPSPLAPCTTPIRLAPTISQVQNSNYLFTSIKTGQRISVTYNSALATLRGVTFPQLSQLDILQYSNADITKDDWAYACKAAVYVMIARALGEKSSSINDFWSRKDGAIQTGIIAGRVSDYTTFVGSAALTAIKSGSPVILEGYVAPGKVHYVLATGIENGLIVANDPWTGAQIRIDPVTGKIVSPIGFPFNFVASRMQTISI